MSDDIRGDILGPADDFGDDLGGFEDFEDMYDGEDEAGTAGGAGPMVGGRGFLGMTPVERMFLSIFLFLNVFIIGLALLVATDRITL